METQEQLAGRFTTATTMVVKDITSGDINFIEVTPGDVSFLISDKARYQNSMNNLQSTINKVIDNLTDEYWFNSETSKETVLAELCELLGHTPLTTWVVSVEIDGRTYDVEVQSEDEDDAIQQVRSSMDITVDEVRYTVDFEGESVDVREEGWNIDIDTDQFIDAIEFSANKKFE